MIRSPAKGGNRAAAQHPEPGAARMRSARAPRGENGPHELLGHVGRDLGLGRADVVPEANRLAVAVEVVHTRGTILDVTLEHASLRLAERAVEVLHQELDELAALHNGGPSRRWGSSSSRSA